MLSISSAKSAAASIDYFSDHLNPDGAPIRRQAEDYYSAEGDPGTWVGSGAAALGLAGSEVTSEAFAAIAAGAAPDGTSLIGSHQRKTDPAKRRAGWDCTFSAPKSVSVAWALGGEEQRAAIQRAHDRAVEAALKKLEAEAIFTRRGKGGAELEPGRMVAAVFRHGTSRSQDPQLHSHAFIHNLAQRADDSWGGIQSREIFARKMALGAYYRAALAHELRALGFEVERDGRSFRLAGMDQRLERRFSKRRSEIEQTLAEAGARSAKASEVAALRTRQRKERLDRAELAARWEQEAAELGVTRADLTPAALRRAAEREREAERLAAEVRGEEWAPPPAEMPTFAGLMREATERASTITEHQLAALVYERAQGLLSPEEAEDYLADLIESEHVVRLRSGDRVAYTSREMWELESGLADMAERRAQESRHQVSDAALAAALAARPTLSEEQAAMVRHVTAGAGIAAVNGKAGTGKSFALGAAREAWELDGRRVIGAAPSGKAADELQAGAGIESSTIHRLLLRLDRGEVSLDERHVIVIDEAGMVESRLLDRVLRAADEAGAKVVLVGDTRQLQPIGAGGAFRLIQQRIGYAELGEIRRQRDEWARDVVRDVERGAGKKAMAELSRRGLVHVEPDRDAAAAKLVQRWLAGRDPAQPGEALMIAARRADVRRLNDLARQHLASTGELDLARAVSIEGSHFAPGDRIIFGRNDSRVGVRNGTLATLVSVDRSSGDRLILRARADDGQEIEWCPDDYGDVAHGYAVTAHKSQGMTVDRAYVLVDESMSDLHWSYVALSRSRESTEVFADAMSWPAVKNTMELERLKTTTQDFELER